MIVIIQQSDSLQFRSLLKAAAVHTSNPTMVKLNSFVLTPYVLCFALLEYISLLNLPDRHLTHTLCQLQFCPSHKKA